GAAYAVVADGRVVCRTSVAGCSVTRVLGPAIEVVVRVLGADRTSSTDRVAVPEGDRQVLMATVYFGPGEDTLTDRQTAALHRVADRIRAMGFRHADLEGYTDSDGGAAYNLRLSHRRTQTVAQLLGGREIGSSQAWFGMNDPASTNQSAAGKAANRRVEIYVGF
ncbi:MAG TPA: OmpA family protein, partial [Nocardioides sp.]|nr:OmpA family protein [Nocardioides sp.]